MPKVVISDTSCFILLSKIGEIDILNKLYNEVVTTKTILDEFGEDLPSWIRVEIVKDKKFQQVLATTVDEGEASAIALSLEIENAMLILDDLKARKLASKLELKFTGTLGVLIRAKKEGHIKSLKEIIVKIKETNFRISDELVSIMLKEVNEN